MKRDVLRLTARPYVCAYIYMIFICHSFLVFPSYSSHLFTFNNIYNFHNTSITRILQRVTINKLRQLTRIIHTFSYSLTILKFYNVIFGLAIHVVTHSTLHNTSFTIIIYKCVFLVELKTLSKNDIVPLCDIICQCLNKGQQARLLLHGMYNVFFRFSNADNLDDESPSPLQTSTAIATSCNKIEHSVHSTSRHQHVNR